MELRPFVMCFALCVVYATSKPTEKKDRVHHDDPLSNLEHDDAENFDYDHEAFLGQEEAKTFDQLTPEESKERLRLAVAGVMYICEFLFASWLLFSTACWWAA